MHISYLERGKTIDHKTFIDKCLEPMQSTLKKKRPHPVFDSKKRVAKNISKVKRKDGNVY